MKYTYNNYNSTSGNKHKDAVEKESWLKGLRLIYPCSFTNYIDRLEQERRNSIANALEFRLSSTNPLTWHTKPPLCEKRLFMYTSSDISFKYIFLNENPPVGSGTPAFRLGSRIDPHRHRGVVKVHWRVPWVGGLFSWVVATFTL